MTMRHVLLALAGLGLAGACASDENEPQDANDENREMQSEAGGEPFGNGNLVAAPVEPVPPAEPVPPPPTPEEAERTRLCEGIAQPESCPIAAGSVQRVQNIDGGVVMLMRADPTTNMEQVQRRIACFGAASTVRNAESDCIFSMPGVNSEVSEDAGKVRIRVLTTEASQVRALRNGARTLARRVGGTAHGSTPSETTMSGDEPGGDVRGHGAQTGSPASTGNDVGTGAQTRPEPSNTPR
jgi:hypothetical protein